MKNDFLCAYAKDAIQIDIKFKSGFYFFETPDNIFVLADANVSGCITEKTKINLDNKILNSEKPNIYVSMYKSKNDFKQSLMHVAWGTYVWCLDNPNHYIHFDNKPSKLITNKTTNF